MPLHLASGTGVSSKSRQKVIRFVRYGCANRPFYHIVVMNVKLFIFNKIIYLRIHIILGTFNKNLEYKIISTLTNF
jgi:hypothetical protein